MAKRQIPVADAGEGLGGGGGEGRSPLSLYKTEARRAEKFFFEIAPLPLSGSGSTTKYRLSNSKTKSM